MTCHDVPSHVSRLPLARDDYRILWSLSDAVRCVKLCQDTLWNTLTPTPQLAGETVWKWLECTADKDSKAMQSDAKGCNGIQRVHSHAFTAYCLRMGFDAFASLAGLSRGTDALVDPSRLAFKKTTASSCMEVWFPEEVYSWKSTFPAQPQLKTWFRHIHNHSYMFQNLVLIFSIFRFGLASLQLARALRSRGQVGALQPGLWCSPLAINRAGQNFFRCDGIVEGLHWTSLGLRKNLVIHGIQRILEQLGFGNKTKYI